MEKLKESVKDYLTTFECYLDNPNVNTLDRYNCYYNVFIRTKNEYIKLVTLELVNDLDFASDISNKYARIDFCKKEATEIIKNKIQDYITIINSERKQMKKVLD